VRDPMDLLTKWVLCPLSAGAGGNRSKCIITRAGFASELTFLVRFLDWAVATQSENGFKPCLLAYTAKPSRHVGCIYLDSCRDLGLYMLDSKGVPENSCLVGDRRTHDVWIRGPRWGESFWSDPKGGQSFGNQWGLLLLEVSSLAWDKIWEGEKLSLFPAGSRDQPNPAGSSGLGGHVWPTPSPVAWFGQFLTDGLHGPTVPPPAFVGPLEAKSHFHAVRQ
jgi:hypothetical protein